MKKTIYAYFNNDDLSELLDVLLQKNIPLFNDKREQITVLPFAEKNITEVNLYSKNNGCVIFTPCYFLGNQLQCGSFCLIRENDSSASLELFSQIKKVVRYKFNYSKANACYYGPGFYDDWTNKKFCLPILLDYDRIELPADKIDNIFLMIENAHFRVKPNNVRLRDVDRVHLSTPSFIIYSHEDLLVRTVVKKSWIRYEYGSTCIFVDKDERKDVYSLMLDKRLSKDATELKLFFENTKICEVVQEVP